MKSQRSAVKAEVNKTWQHHFTDKKMDNCKACAKERKVVCQYIPLSLKLFFRRERTITTKTSLVRLGQRRSVCFHFKVLLMASLESSVWARNSDSFLVNEGILWYRRKMEKKLLYLLRRNRRKTHFYRVCQRLRSAMTNSIFVFATIVTNK